MDDQAMRTAAAAHHQRVSAAMPTRAFPPPNKPLPTRPPRPPSPRRKSSSSSYSSFSTSFSFSFATRRNSATIEPLTLAGSRPDSTILPLPLPLQRPSALERQNFHALVRKGDVLQYWLPVGLVLRGFPGRGAVPQGHWEKLVRLAQDVAVGEGEVVVQLVTGWCNVDEPLGEDDGEGENSKQDTYG